VNNNYYSHKSGVSCIEFKHYLPSSVGDILKYVWRAGKKQYPGLSLEESCFKDIAKAKDYLEYCQVNGIPTVSAENEKKIKELEIKFLMGRDFKELTKREVLCMAIATNLRSAERAFLLQDILMTKKIDLDWLDKQRGNNDN
jgi:hypothetical protein